MRIEIQELEQNTPKNESGALLRQLKKHMKETNLRSRAQNLTKREKTYRNQHS